MKQWLYTGSLAIAILVCMVPVIIPAAMAADGTNGTSIPGSNITVITWPAGAAVHLNGEYRGITPVKIGNLAPGKYVVEVFMAGYKNETFIRTLSLGSMDEIGINLELASSVPAPTGSGTVAIDSSPGGASVSLDGNPVGKTPAGHAALILNSVPAGSHTVTVELAGFPQYTANVTVIRNQLVQVNADFTPRSPTIPGTPIATTDRREPVPLSPLSAIAAAGVMGLAAAFRRS